MAHNHSTELEILDKEDFRTVIEDFLDSSLDCFSSEIFAEPKDSVKTLPLNEEAISNKTMIASENTLKATEISGSTEFQQNKNRSKHSIHDICTSQIINLKVPKRNYDGTGNDTQIVTIKIYRIPPNMKSRHEDEEDECSNNRLKASWEAAEQKYLQEGSQLSQSETEDDATTQSNVTYNITSKTHQYVSKGYAETAKKVTVPKRPPAEKCANCAARKTDHSQWVRFWETRLRQLRHELRSERLQYEKRLDKKIQEIKELLQNKNYN